MDLENGFDESMPLEKSIEAVETYSEALKSVKPKVENATINDQESAVGITAFVSPEAPGFQCVIKQRYTDFLVNEILPSGEVVHLTSLGVSSTRKKRKGADQARGYLNGDENGDAEPADAAEQHDKQAIENDAAGPRKKRKIDEIEPTAPEPSQATFVPESTESDGTAAPKSNQERKVAIVSQITEPDQGILRSIFGGDTTTQVLDLYVSVITHPDRKPRDHATVKSPPISDKSKRTEAHVAVRRIFNSKLETLTMQDEPGVMSIKAAPPKGPSGARGQPNGYAANGAFQKGKQGWEDLGGEYLHFTLYKENKDTMEALFFIATQLKVPAKNFEFAGTKDRRGVTVQRVAIYRVHAETIARLNKNARGWRAGNFEYKKYGLDLGELGGNEFLLTLKDCQFEHQVSLSHADRLSLAKDVVGRACDSFGEKGFLNYYGLQRFGTFRTGTHYTGRMMLKGDLEGAVNSILEYSNDMLPENQDESSSKKVPQDDINRAEAIKIWRTTGRSQDAVSKMPRRFQAESAIIQFLGKRDRKTGKLLQDTDWQGGLMQIQRNLRLMYVHAYQSHVWNTVVSKRWELYGNEVVAGDLVIVGEKDDGLASKKDDVDEDGEPIFHPAADDSAPTAEDAFERARHLTDAEAKSGRYDIFDIVLPLPGFDVEYPANEIGKFYEEFMASEVGGGLDPHKMRRGWKDVSLSGGYRKMMARPSRKMEFEVKSYVNDEDQMVRTDLERLQQDDGSVIESGQAQVGEKIAVVLQMQLGSSQYATMALRELTKGGAVNYKPDYSSR